MVPDKFSTASTHTPTSPLFGSRSLNCEHFTPREVLDEVCGKKVRSPKNDIIVTKCDSQMISSDINETICKKLWYCFKFAVDFYYYVCYMFQLFRLYIQQQKQTYFSISSSNRLLEETLSLY